MMAALRPAVGSTSALPRSTSSSRRPSGYGHGRKNDDADAVSVGIAALNATGLQSIQIDQTIMALRAVVEHRDDLVKQRTPDSGGHTGAAPKSSAAGSTPTTGSSEKSLPGPANTDATPPT